MTQEQIKAKRAKLVAERRALEAKSKELNGRIMALQCLCRHPNKRIEHDNDCRMPSSTEICDDCGLNRSF